MRQNKAEQPVDDEAQELDPGHRAALGFAVVDEFRRQITADAEEVLTNLQRLRTDNDDVLESHKRLEDAN